MPVFSPPRLGRYASASSNVVLRDVQNTGETPTRSDDATVDLNKAIQMELLQMITYRKSLDLPGRQVAGGGHCARWAVRNVRNPPTC